ncbi:MAG: SDR family NAD(P)-dependent oxidoreductase [Myxococcota bacterium]|nr:SDR family NAD(P)-dependent oxidoreductase [Myxococcota bacterium]
MHTDLTGRTAIVTGAGGGIGRATAHALARLGAAVVVNDIGRRADGTATAEIVTDEIRNDGARATANTDSVTEWSGAGNIVATAQREFGSVDILVNNAGIAWSGVPWEIDSETFDRVVATHVQGSFHCSRHAIAPMREQRWGRIVSLVSRAGLTGMPNTLPYAVGKGGVLGLTNALSRDLDGTGITVNAVNPASTSTPMVAAAMASLDEMGEEGRKRSASLRAQMQTPEHVAVMIASLCLPAAANITGQIFLVEHTRIGLFQPLTVTQDVDRNEPWTPEALCEVLGKFELHGLDDAYS